MTHVKKWLAMVLCLAMCFSMFPTCVLAEEDGAVTENYAETENFSPLSELPQKWEEPELPEIPEETETDGDTELAEEFNSIPEDEESAVTDEELMPDATEEETIGENPSEENADAQDNAGAEETAESDPEEETEFPDEETAPEQAEEDAEVEEQSELQPIVVHFILTPEEAVLTVFTKDETGEKTELPAEEDGSWLLLPGEYFYRADSDNYESIEEERFELLPGEAERVIEVALHSLDEGQGSAVDLNPAFPWVQESDLLKPDEAEIQAASSGGTVTVLTPNAAANYIRTAMENRATTIVVTLARSSPDPHWKELLDQAMEHTGVPTQGDYIRYHYFGCNVRWTYNNQIITFTYTVTYSTDANQEAYVNSAVSYLRSYLNLNQGTAYDRIRRIYNYLTSTVTYDHARLNNGDPPIIHSAYCALIEHTCVCQGYAVAFYRLALEAGVDTRYVNSVALNHAWNIVRMDGYYYYVDATWDAREVRDNYVYYLMGRNDWLRDHDLGVQFSDSSFASRYTVPTNNYSRPGSASVLINESTFPDSYFRWYVSAYFDINGDGLLSDNEAASANVITCNSQGVTSLKGIEYFTELTRLGCTDGNLTSLDLTNLHKMEWLDCARNRISYLRISKTYTWDYICIAGNNLGSISLQDMASVRCLDCAGNPMGSVDISGCSGMERLYCMSCSLTSLNVSGCSKLLTILANSNQLGSIDISSCPKLRYLDIRSNSLSSLDISRCPDVLRAYRSGTRTVENGSVSYKESNGSFEYDSYFLGYDSGIELITHYHTPGTPTKENVIPSTCTEQGSYTEVICCSTCGQELSRTGKKTAALGHSLTGPDRKTPTCTEPGHEAYWTCTLCGKRFGDGEGKTEITSPVSIPATGHREGTPVRENEVPATCTAEGYFDEVVYCTACGKELSRQRKLIEKAPHQTALKNAVLPTHEADGYSGDEYCIVCGQAFGQGQKIPALPAEEKAPDLRELRFDREYLLLKKGETAQLQLPDIPEEWLRFAEWNVDRADVAAFSGTGVVCAASPGTAMVSASITSGEYTATARCRVDVLNEPLQGNTEIVATIPENTVLLDLYKTDYAKVNVVLRLTQNVTTAGVTAQDGSVLGDAGVMMQSARFVGGGKADIRQVFGLRVIDDRNLEIIPLVDLRNEAAIKAVAGSYQSAITVTLSDGSEATTPELTVKVNKNKPKLTVKPVTVNGFIAGQTVPLEIIGATVTSIEPQDLGFARLNEDLTVTVKEGVIGNGKRSVNITVKPDDWAIEPMTLKLTVNNQYKAPKVALKPASVTLNRAYSDRVSVPVTLTPLAGMTHTVTASGVSGLTAEYDNGKGAVVVGVGTAAAGNYSIPVKADGKTVANLKVKVIDSSAVTLTAKAAGAIDTAVEKSPILITVTGKNINGEAGTYRVKFLQAKGKEAAVEVKDLFTYTQSGNVITVTGKDALKNYVKGYTYTAEVSSSVGTAKPVKLTVKASVKTPAPTVTLKASGSIDVLRPGTELVLTPTFKNWFDYDEAKFGLRLSNPDLDYRYKDGVFTVFAKENADVDPALNQAWMTYEGRDVTAKPVKLSLKMGKAIITQSTKTVTLSKNDRYDRQSVILSLSDSSLYDIRDAKVTMTDPSGNLRLIELGNGEYAIGYKDSKLPGNIAKLKSSTVKLVVFLQGNGGSKANATLSVKVNFA